MTPHMRPIKADPRADWLQEPGILAITGGPVDNIRMASLVRSFSRMRKRLEKALRLLEP